MSRAIDVMQYYSNHLSPLVGCEVIAIVIDATEHNEVYTGYVLKDKQTGQEYELVAMRDPEGNGPGHLAIHPLLTMPPSKDTNAS